MTRTDVAQAEARRADAVSRLDAARANLRTSNGSFQQVVGHPPEGLSWASTPYRDIPKSLQEATGICNNENPLVVAALYREQAAKYLIDQILAASCCQARRHEAGIGRGASRAASGSAPSR